MTDGLNNNQDESQINYTRFLIQKFKLFFQYVDSYVDDFEKC